MRVHRMLSAVGLVGLIILGVGVGMDRMAALAQEHGGQGVQEHGGQEHGGKKATGFTAAQIKDALKAYIDQKTKGGKEPLTLKDDKTGETLALVFVKVHDPVRKFKDGRFFACTDFHPQGAPEKLYDLDFWLTPKGDRLEVTEVRIHKEPKLVDGKWEKVPRYTFKGDEVVEIQ